MSLDPKKLFAFHIPLPPPFDKVPKKVKVTSVYGDGTDATLCATTIKAINALCGCMDGSGIGAIGICDQHSVAEYKSASSPDEYHIVVYNQTTGKVLAGVYDKASESIAAYTVSKTGRDGSAVMFAMLPALMTDSEFQEKFEEYRVIRDGGFTDMNEAVETMAILCDNAYRRIVDSTCSAHVPMDIADTGNITRFPQTHLDAGTYAPKTVNAGEFTILSQTGPAPVIKASEATPHEDFVGKYVLNESRTLSAAEQSMIPVLEPWYVLPKEVESICKHAKKSTEKSMPMRNFLLRGPAGTGKTEGAKAIAAGLGLPYMKYTCSANSEVFDFIGMVFPQTDAGTTGDAALDEERKMLMSMGGINYANVAKLLNLPGLDDMDYDPEGVYQALTGVTKAGATSQDCMAIVMERVTDKVRQLSQVKTDGQQNGQTYTYTETDFIKALKLGYVAEIQEPATIMQPGVLVGLNSLLEQGGSITLPTGEVVKRHPDAVVIITTNTEYEGCRGMNQSVLDRMSLTLDIELPAPEIMAKRVMSITGCDDDVMVSDMVRVVNDMAVYCRKNGISDGAVGMRSLIDWVISSEITGDPYTSALFTVISKATADEDDRETLIASVLEPVFAPKRRAAAS